MKIREFGQSPTSTPFRPSKTLSRGGGFNPDKQPEKPLTGQVQGQRAAQGEERLARSIDKAIAQGFVTHHLFRWTTLKRTVVANFKELDELVFTIHGPVAISVKGETFVHKGESARQQDKLNELIILTQLRRYGIDVRTVTSIAAEKLTTQADADKAARDAGVYR